MDRRDRGGNRGRERGVGGIVREGKVLNEIEGR